MKEIYLLSLTYVSGKKGQRDTTRWYNSVYLAYCSDHNMSNQPVMYARTCTVSLLTSMRTCFYCIFAGIDKSAYFGLKEEKNLYYHIAVLLNDSLVNE